MQPHGSTSNSNDDDLYLLWLILSRKAKDILKEHNVTPNLNDDPQHSYTSSSNNDTNNKNYTIIATSSTSIHDENGNEWIDWKSFNLERILYILQEMRTLQYDYHNHIEPNGNSIKYKATGDESSKSTKITTSRINYNEVEMLIDVINEALANQ